MSNFERPYREVKQLVAEEGGLMRWIMKKGFGGVWVIVIDEKIGLFGMNYAGKTFPALDELYVPGTIELVEDARERLLAKLK